MASKKFTIDGREYESYQLSNEQILSLIKDTKTCSEDRDFLMEKVLERFEYDLCPKCGEKTDTSNSKPDRSRFLVSSHPELIHI